MGTIDLVVRAFQEWANEAGIDDCVARLVAALEHRGNIPVRDLPP